MSTAPQRASSSPHLVVGIDVGGTFTDLFLYDEETRQGYPFKVPSTRGEEAVGFLNGLHQLGHQLSEIASVIHGTTVGTNALLERKGAKTGLITSRGFRDVIEMRRRDRRQTWGLWGEFKPVIPRDLRLEVDELTLASGEVVEEVDAEQIRRCAQELLDQGVEAVCVLFINTYANAHNERLAGEILREVWPNDYINLSYQVLNEIREFERGSTTVLNGYLQPVVSRYMARLEEALARDQFEGEFLIVQSNGGVMDVPTTRTFPVKTALSGPAAGVTSCAYIAQLAGFEDVITCDMGGTSFDISLVTQSQSHLCPQTTIDFGMTIRTPMIEITTIGAGGGSIAWIDAGGFLRIGPESAGSVPGPVCYGQGNTRPTLTDANLVLGRINPDRPIGGQLDRLDIEGAREAIREHIAEPLGLDVLDAAEAMIQIANADMAGAVRLISIERGYDPQRFVAMPFGGGGALHTGALIKEVGLKQALVPRFPGIGSAIGCVMSDMRHDFIQTLNQPLNAVDVAQLQRQMYEMALEGYALLDQSGVQLERVDIIFELDMSYVGQTHTIAATLPLTSHFDRARPRLEASTFAISSKQIQEAFDRAYLEAYGRLLEQTPTRVMSLRGAVIGRRPTLDLTSLRPSDDASIESAYRGKREVYYGGRAYQADLYDRLALPVGARIEGPALLEQPDTTILIDPDLYGEVDAWGNVMILRRGAQ